MAAFQNQYDSIYLYFLAKATASGAHFFKFSARVLE